MTAYLISMGAGLLLATLLFALRIKGSAARRAGQALLTAALMVVLGFLCAKAVYTLALAKVQFTRYGMGAFIHLNMEEFSVFGGALGVTLAAVLAAKAFRIKATDALNAFAPSGALLLLTVRASEYFISNRFLGHGLIGMGADLMDNDPLCFFPFAIPDAWGIWFYAVFMLETCVALIALVLSLTAYRRHCTFLRTAFFLMVCQIFCESLHNQSIRWGFVRVEQLLCAVGAMVVVVLHCAAWRKASGASFRSAFGWCLPLLLLFGVDVGVEFALDKTALILATLNIEVAEGFPLESVTFYASYGAMLLSIAGMLAIEHTVVRRRVKTDA